MTFKEKRGRRVALARVRAGCSPHRGKLAEVPARLQHRFLRLAGAGIPLHQHLPACTSRSCDSRQATVHSKTTIKGACGGRNRSAPNWQRSALDGWSEGWLSGACRTAPQCGEGAKRAHGGLGGRGAQRQPPPAAAAAWRQEASSMHCRAPRSHRCQAAAQQAAGGRRKAAGEQQQASTALQRSKAAGK